MILAGRGWGKTRTGAEDVAAYGLQNENSRIAIIAPTTSDARKVCLEGVSGLMSVLPESCIAKTNLALGEVHLMNGTVYQTFGAEEPNRLRGPQFHRSWCFIAGTKIHTLRGEIPIESITTDDKVLTRGGYRTVVFVSRQMSAVGKVCFSNGSNLVGTAEHPIYNHGWTRLDQLAIGDEVCAIAASSGAEKSGIPTMGDITSEPKRTKALERTLGFIVKSGNQFMGKYPCDSMSTTKMMINRTILQTTLSASVIKNICDFMHKKTRLLKRIGVSFQKFFLSVKIAIKPSKESPERAVQFVANAKRGAPKKIAKKTENARIAAKSSEAEPEFYAAHVASTWQPMGRQFVYCLKVAEQSEYFANGILVHNCDELAAWNYPETFDQLMFGLRLGEKPQCIITTTPRPTQLVKNLMNRSDCVVTRGSTFENSENLAASALHQLREKYEGTRLGRQELYAEILSDVQGALWLRSNIDETRVKEIPQLIRIVVAVDPAISNHEGSDETGIIVAGRGRDGNFYVLADRSGHYSPEEWAREAVAQYDLFKADRIIAESNQGGEMVERTLRVIRKNAPITLVHASRGKVTRAEPVAALYEQKRGHHVGAFPVLEDQMCQFTSDFDRSKMGYSPDRVDALVWAATALMEAKMSLFSI